MILKASQRGGASQLAAHLLKTTENEHVELHEIRGLIAEDVRGALHEMYGQSLGTQCRQFFFTVSLSPPEEESVSAGIFEEALDKIETRLGLKGQPRVVVFHEKEGRRHAHCVWSRIRMEEMNAVNLPFFKMKLQDVSRELYRENGWTMPRGFVDKQERSPLNFTAEQWHQARRMQEDTKALKALFQDCWSRSDSRESFRQALREKGFTLARGDKRGFVAVDFRGEVCSLSRWTGVKNKELAARLGDPASLPDVASVKAELARAETTRLKQYAQDVRKQARQGMNRLSEQKKGMAQKHRQERDTLRTIQKDRWRKESRERRSRIPEKWERIWKSLTGEYRKIRRENETEILANRQRDREQQQALIDYQKEERQALQAQILEARKAYQDKMNELREYMAHYATFRERQTLSPAFAKLAAKQAGQEQIPNQTPPLKNTFGKASTRQKPEPSPHDRGRVLSREFNCTAHKNSDHS